MDTNIAPSLSVFLSSPPGKDEISVIVEAKGPMSLLQRVIERLRKDFVRIDAADAFVVSVTASQLQQLVVCRYVNYIRPNQEHRVTK